MFLAKSRIISTAKQGARNVQGMKCGFFNIPNHFESACKNKKRVHSLHYHQYELQYKEET